MIQENQFKLKGFVIWILCALFFLYEFFLRTVVGTFQLSIMRDLELSALQFSIISTTVFLLIYSAMQIPAGLIVNSIGLKKSMIIGVLLCTLSSFGFAYAQNYYYAFFFRMIMGFGASFGFICLLVAVYDWMPHKYNALFVGLSQFIGTMGPMLAAGPVDTLSANSNISWRFIFLILGIIGSCIAFSVIFLVENNQQTSGKYTVLAKPEKTKKIIFRLFSRAEPWFIAIFSGSIYCAIEYLSENEGRNFIILKGFSSSSASYMLTIAWLGYAIGCPLLGYLSDIIQRRKGVIVFAALLNLLSILGIMFAAHQHTLFILFFMLGLSSSGQTISFALASEQFKKQFVATGLALNNSLIGFIISSNAPIIAKIIDSSNIASQGPTLAGYYSAFSALAITSFIALTLATTLIKETYCKSRVSFTYLTRELTATTKP